MPKRISKDLQKNPDKPLAPPPDHVVDAIKTSTRRKKDNRQLKQKADPWRPSEHAFYAYIQFSKGRSQFDIAAELKIGREAVYTLIRKVRDYLADQMIDEINGLRQEHVDRLMHVAAEAMLAWEKSKKDAESEIVSDGGKDGPRTTRTKSGQSGNVAYLSEYRAALKEIRDLLGVKPIMAPEGGGGELRVAGRDRAEVIQEAIARMQQRMASASPN